MASPRLRALSAVLLFAGTLAFAQTQPNVEAQPDGGGPIQGNGASSVKPPDMFSLRESSPKNWGLPAPGEDPDNHLFRPFAKHLMQDQEQFWGYPFHASREDGKYLLPFLGITAAFVASDRWISKQVPDSPVQLKHSLDFSNYAAYSLVGAAGGAYLWGHITHNDHLSEAGMLATEAIINSTAISYALKGMTQRPRPLVGNG